MAKTKTNQTFRMGEEDVENLEVLAKLAGIPKSEILRKLIPTRIQIEAAKAYVDFMSHLDLADESPGILKAARQGIPQEYREIMTTDPGHPMEDATIAWHMDHPAFGGAEGEEIILRVFITWAKAYTGQDGFYFAKVQDEKGEPVMKNGRQVETILRRAPNPD